MDLPESLLTLNGFLLTKCAHVLSKELDHALSFFHVRSKHFGIMLLVSEVEEINQQQIGELLRMDRNTMVLLIDELEKVDYVERVKSKADRRAYNIVLTKKGREALPEMRKVAGEIEQGTLSQLKPAEVDLLQTLLRKILY